jgi:hypothetical protein
MARVPTGQQFVNKTPIPAPRTSRAKPAETHRLRAKQHRSTTTIINQAPRHALQERERLPDPLGTACAISRVGRSDLCGHGIVVVFVRSL